MDQVGGEGKEIKGEDDVHIDLEEEDVDGPSGVEEVFDVLEAEDDFEKKIITKIFNLCRNGDLEKLKSLENTYSRRRMTRWLASHDDKYSMSVIVLKLNISVTIEGTIHPSTAPP